MGKAAGTPPPRCGYVLMGPGLPCALPAGHPPPHQSAPKVSSRPTPTKKPTSPQLAQQDASYRKQLGVEPGEQLPRALGSPMRDVDQADRKGQSRRGKRRRPRVTRTDTSTQATSKKPVHKEQTQREPKRKKPTQPGATSVPRATEPTICRVCGRQIAVGAPVGLHDDRIAHRACAQRRQWQSKILRGETFRGHKASTWRLGKGPGNTPERH
jgi:hypothetical protein